MFPLAPHCTCTCTSCTNTSLASQLAHHFRVVALEVVVVAVVTGFGRTSEGRAQILKVSVRSDLELLEENDIQHFLVDPSFRELNL